MILQYILFPDKSICSENQLYYHSIDNIKCKQDGIMEIGDGQTLRFDSYFNSFSISKWKEYTNIDNLYLNLLVKGQFNITIINQYYNLNKIITKEIYTRDYQFKNLNKLTIKIPLSKIKKGNIGFTITAKNSKVHIYDGYYSTKVMSQRLNKVSLGLNICTYLREDYIRELLKVVKELSQNSKYSLIRERLYTFIVDNGNSLHYNTEPNVFTFYNKNTGGTGGFTRGIIEILKKRKEFNLTHIIFLDDDITLFPESLYRMFTFLLLIKDEKSNCLFSGAMLLSNKTYLQHSSGEIWRNGRAYSPKRGLDLRRVENVLKNEIQVRLNYCAWGYCCVPLKLVSEDNLPLPLFIHQDDIEYGLRLDQEIITLNGVCMWHGDFSTRRNSELEYYRVRNSMIINSIYISNYSCKKAKICLLKQVTRNVLYYRYKDIDISLKAMWDFCKGIEYLKKQDPIQLHQELRDLGYQLKTIRNIPNCQEKKHGYISSFKSLLTFNGYFFSGKNKKIYIGDDYRSYYRTNLAIVYNDENKGLYLKRDIRKMVSSYKKLRAIFKVMDIEFKSARDSYQNKWNTIANIDFWNEYLGIKGK
ncbi:MAG: hypothetical protein KH020_02375 [Clostridiales bacterium]|nr:hypothetical protein [Clostridiales bacterium]